MKQFNDVEKYEIEVTKMSQNYSLFFSYSELFLRVKLCLRVIPQCSYIELYASICAVVVGHVL